MTIGSREGSGLADPEDPLPRYPAILEAPEGMPWHRQSR